MTPIDHMSAVFADQVGWVFIGQGTGQHLTASGKVEHKHWREDPFRWPAETDKIVERLASDDTADWYYTPSLSENPVRKLSSDPNRKTATRKPMPVSVLWADCDGDHDPIKAQYVVDRGGWRVSSGTSGRFHLYLPLIEPVGFKIGDLLERLARHLGADVAVARHGAYLRPVGTLNHKARIKHGTEPTPVVEFEQPCEPRWTAEQIDDLLPPLEAHAEFTIDVPKAEHLNGQVNDRVAAILDEWVADDMDRSARTMIAVNACLDAGMSEGQIITALRQHRPSVDKYGPRVDREVIRCVRKSALPDAETSHTSGDAEFTTQGEQRFSPSAGAVPLSDCHAVVRRWFGDEYDLDALHVVLAAAAVEQLNGDPLWVLVISGSGNAKTETVQTLGGAGAYVTSTITSIGALLSASSRRDKAKDATGGLLRKLGDRGVLVIKDVTSIISQDRNTRGEVLAALREVYDGRWERNVGTDGGRTLTWTGRIAVIGAVTTAWDKAHDVIASMGDRFVLIRVDSNEGRVQAGRRSIGNTGSEEQMRAELAAVVAGVLAGVQKCTPVDMTYDETDRLLAAADVVTIGRTGVEYDYRGDVIDAHAPEMPTRFAKQLAQVVRGAIAIGIDRDEAIRLAIRCARDSMPPLRLAILLDVAAHPLSTTSDVRKRLDKPRATVDRQLQSLHILGLLECDESTAAHGSSWRYRLAKGIDPKVLDPSITRKVTDQSLALIEEGRERQRLPSHISGNQTRPCPNCLFGRVDETNLCSEPLCASNDRSVA
jgi:hypothetical protein